MIDFLPSIILGMIIVLVENKNRMNAALWVAIAIAIGWFFTPVI